MRDRIQFKEVPNHIVYDPVSIPVIEGAPIPPMWSGETWAPEVGARVKIVLNGWKIGGKETDRGDIPATVIGYRVDAGWLMAVVEADFVPHWYMQLGRGRIAVFAGRELEPL